MVRYKFKVGQRVRYTGKKPSYCDLDNGDIATISARKEFDGEASYGFKEDKTEKGKAHWLLVHENFEAVTHLFQVGDKIQCMNGSGYPWDKGKIHTVTSRDTDGDGDLLYGFKDDTYEEGTSSWLKVEESFKKALVQTKKIKPSKAKPKPVDQFQVLADIFME